MTVIHRTAMLVAVIVLVSAGQAIARPWQRANPASPAWSEETIRTYMEGFKPTALMVVQDGSVVTSLGDVSRKVDVASVRKSLLSALYGIAVAEGRIDLGSTLDDLGIDDKPPALTAAEKQATVRDLLTARSGVYHSAAHETADIRQKRPARGSHASGSFWFYNNWDFNALGTIYRRRTGEDLFRSFAQRIAVPIGMEDFAASDGRYSLETSSVHPAYPFKMSARDLARFGQLFLDGGRWDGKQIVPNAWVRDAVTEHSRTDRGTMGYGYLWWTLNPEVFGPGAAQASGYGGQHVAVIPSKRLVVVQVVSSAQNAKRIRTSSFVDLLRQVFVAAP